RMGVLATILPDPRQVSLDVTGIQWRAVEGGAEKEEKSVTAPHQVFLHGGHRARAPGWLGRSGDDTPRLRDRIDPTLRIRRRAERRPIVEVRTAIPVAVPGLSLERVLENADVPPPPFGTRPLTARVGQLRPFPEHGVEKPAQPDAFALALVADAIHPIVPVSG